MPRPPLASSRLNLFPQKAVKRKSHRPEDKRVAPGFMLFVKLK